MKYTVFERECIRGGMYLSLIIITALALYYYYYYHYHWPAPVVMSTAAITLSPQSEFKMTG